MMSSVSEDENLEDVLKKALTNIKGTKVLKSNTCEINHKSDTKSE